MQVIKAELTPLQINYSSASGYVIDNGHTIQFNNEDQQNYIIVDEQQYVLTQFHLHTPSENKINNQRFPLEAHFVHTNKDGELLVMAIMFKEGKENHTLKQLLTNNEHIELPKHLVQADLSSLLPVETSYYRFSGSLTTPPCSEGVIWIILKEPQTLSTMLIEQLKITLQFPNSRSIQPLNGRLIIEN